MTALHDELAAIAQRVRDANESGGLGARSRVASIDAPRLVKALQAVADARPAAQAQAQSAGDTPQSFFAFGYNAALLYVTDLIAKALEVQP